MSCGPMAAEAATITEDAVLGGRLRLRQPKRGHRVGHDAILLAAATGARAGEHAVDLGAGVGAAGLALAARIPGLQVTLVEIDAALCSLAAENIVLNGFGDRAKALVGDAEDISSLAAAGLAPGSIDRILMNPPFNSAARHQASPDPRRHLAHTADAGLLAGWVATAAALLKPQGVLTLIWRADGLAEVREALAGAFGGVAILPVLPCEGAADPIRVLVRAAKGGQKNGQKNGQAAEVSYPPLALNDAQNRPTAAAEAVLRSGEALALAALG
jgi:tRNA1(Val) A37 N6-methylase TrmN6